MIKSLSDEEIIEIMGEALDIIIKHFRTLDKLYSKDLEVLNLGSKALAKADWEIKEVKK